MPSEYNPNLVASMEAKFRRLNNPAHALVDSLSMPFGIPGMIAFWPGINGTTAARFGLRDESTSGLHLTGSASPALHEAESTSLRTWMLYNGRSNYHYVADAAYNSILGTSTALASAIRGFTFMAWVRPSSAIGTSETIGAKWLTTGNQRSWRLRRNSTGPLLFSITSDGTTGTLAEVTGSNNLLQNTWHFIAARFTPSTELRIWESDGGALTENANTTSIPAALHDSTTDLMIGASGSNAAPAEYWNGYLSRMILSRAAVPDIFIDTYFQMTAPLFGVSV